MSDFHNQAGATTDAMQGAAERMQAQASQATASTKEINTKVIDHAQENVGEAFNALRAAAAAGTIADVMKVQTDYVQAQAQRSMNQAREIGELIAGFGKSAMEGMNPGK